MERLTWKKPLLIASFLLAWAEVFAQDPDFHIYLCFGQSNMCGAGSIEAQDKTVDPRFQMMEPIGCTNLKRTFGKWYPAVPPLWGCNGGLGPSDYFGRTMVEKLPTSIKVGVIVVAVPGCDIALFYKTGYQGYDTYNTVPSKYNGSAYAWLMDLAKLAQKDGVIKGFLLHQGETNNGQKDWPNKVKKVYDDLIADLELAASKTPLLVGELLYTNQGGSCGGHNAIIARVPEVIPNSYVISAQGLAGKDQWHFTTESNRILGRRYAEKMLTLLEPVTGSKVNYSVSHRKVTDYGLETIAVTKGPASVRSWGYSSCRMVDFRGALADENRAPNPHAAGSGFASGIYFLTIRHNTGK